MNCKVWHITKDGRVEMTDIVAYEHAKEIAQGLKSAFPEWYPGKIRDAARSGKPNVYAAPGDLLIERVGDELLT